MSDIQALEQELMHASVYDPVKAHQYYLRRRQLKGRRPGAGDDISSRSGGRGDQGGTGGTSNSVLRKSREQHLDAQIEELRGKVDRLRELIRARVDKAKERAGVDTSKEDKKTSTTKEKDSSKKEKDSKDKPLTEKQKADKRKASKEQYEKENGTSKAREVQALQNTIENLREKLAKLPKPANDANHSSQSDNRRQDGR